MRQTALRPTSLRSPNSSQRCRAHRHQQETCVYYTPLDIFCREMAPAANRHVSPPQYSRRHGWVGGFRHHGRKGRVGKPSRSRCRAQKTRRSAARREQPERPHHLLEASMIRPAHTTLAFGARGPMLSNSRASKQRAGRTTRSQRAGPPERRDEHAGRQKPLSGSFRLDLSGRAGSGK